MARDALQTVPGPQTPTLQRAGEQSYTTTSDKEFHAADKAGPYRRAQHTDLRASGRWSTEAFDFDVGSEDLYITLHAQRAWLPALNRMSVSVVRVGAQGLVALLDIRLCRTRLLM
jgi:hypothetical protein